MAGDIHRGVHGGPGTDSVDTPGRAISRQDSRVYFTSKTNNSYWKTIQDLTPEMELLCMLFESCISDFISGVVNHTTITVLKMKCESESRIPSDDVRTVSAGATCAICYTTMFLAGLTFPWDMMKQRITIHLYASFCGPIESHRKTTLLC